MGIGKMLKPIVRPVLGKLALWAFPNRAKLIEKAIGDAKSYGLLDRIIRAGFIRNIKEHDRLAILHHRFWAGTEGSQFHKRAGKRFENWFLTGHVSLVVELERLIASNKRNYKYLYEIGCGDGQVINYLSNRLKSIEHFVGIDINADVIALNNQYCRKENLEFACGNATDWICQNGRPKTIFFTNGGVLEYFSIKQITDLLKKITIDFKPSVFAIIEPLATNYNIETETDSRPYGNEFSFSHNYKKLFKSNGFTILYQRETMTGSYRWILMLSKTQE